MNKHRSIKKIKISGAKNSATRLLAASMIADEKTTFYNFPTKIVDANHKKRFIENMGGEVVFDDDHATAEIDAGNLKNEELEQYDYPIRTTYLLVPGLLKKTGMARIPYPGGCNIGSRGYDLHVMVWEKMGATVAEKQSYIEVAARELKGAEINFPISTIGGTETALICGAIATGVTTIRNAYISPEVENLIDYLRATGVEIEVAGNSFVKIYGNTYHRGTTFSVLPDRIEAITWIIFSAVSGIPMLIEDVPFDQMNIPLRHLQEAGVDFFANNQSILITEECISNGIQPFELATGTHPGIISDMQPFYVLLGLKADGISRIYDYRYPERMAYLKELSKFIDGGLEWKDGKITTKGVVKFKPAIANSTDLRGSMAVLLAALIAGNEGESRIDKIHMALRGYNDLENKLKKIGFSLHIENSSIYV